MIIPCLVLWIFNLNLCRFTSKGSRSRFLECFLCVASSSLVACFTSSSCHTVPETASSLSSAGCLGFPSPSCGLEIAPGRRAHHIRFPLIRNHSSVLCIVRCLKIFISCFVHFFLVCFNGKNENTLSWVKAGVCIFKFNSYNLNRLMLLLILFRKT